MSRDRKAVDKSAQSQDIKMATGHSDYTQGSMDVKAQTSTFGGFMSLTMYGGALIAFLLLYPIFLFCTPLAWPASLLVSVIVAFVMGAALKLKAGWYPLIIALAIFLAIFTVSIAAIVP